MGKKVFFIFPIMASVFIFYAIGPANAQCPPPPTSCLLIDSKGSTTPYSLEIYPENNLWPILDVTTNRYNWRYKLNGLNSINQMLFLVPDCCPKTNYYVDSGGQIPTPIGSGDPTTKFGFGIYDDWVVRLASVAGQPTYYFYTDKLVPEKKTSAQIKVGNNIYYCQGGIAGPACPGEFAGILNTSMQQLDLDNGAKICLKKNPLDPCPFPVDCATGAAKELKPIQDMLQGNYGTGYEPIHFAGAPGQECPLVMLRSALDSEHSTWVCTPRGCSCCY
jgi:hypothetical protein